LRRGIEISLLAFRGYSPVKRADLVGKLMFNGMLFGKQEGKGVATKVTRSGTLCIFSSVALLRSIGSHGGALKNDIVPHAISTPKLRQSLH